MFAEYAFERLLRDEIAHGAYPSSDTRSAVRSSLAVSLIEIVQRSGSTLDRYGVDAAQRLRRHPPCHVDGLSAPSI
jgi:hypothetical protein